MPDSPLPPRPTIPAKVRGFVDKWWEKTANCPDQDAAVRASRESLKTLFPSEFDRSDRYRGTIPFELRTRRDDRRVRTNLVYRNVLQTVAMTVPDDHQFRWDIIPFVSQTGDPVPAPADDPSKRLATTMVPVVRQYTKESNFQEVVEGWVQDACQYRLSVIKVTFDRDYVDDTIRMHAEGKDQQENVQDLRVLVEDYRRNVFTKDDSQYKEMTDLMESIGISDEIKLWAGLRTELVPIDCFRFDPCIRGYEQIYDASWMAHDVMMSLEEARAKFPYKVIKDDNGDDTTDWTGVHPDDLNLAYNNLRSTGGAPNPSYYGTSLEKGKGPSPRPDSPAESQRVMVREVWAKKLGRVFTLIDGVPYPVASWVPERTPSQWYPFRVMRLNRVTGQVYGYSDVELQAEIQHRINRKRSDEEKARWLSLPRGIYNTQGIDQTEINKMRDHNPGEWKGLNLGAAKSIKEVMEFQQFQFDPSSFDTSNDTVEMNKMASLPSQMMGSTGDNVKYSSEVSAAMQGAAISSNARGTTIRKALEGTYDMIAEILLQELEPTEVQLVAGPESFWPHIYSEADATAMHEQIVAQVTQEVAQQEQAQQAQAQLMAQQAAQMGMPSAPYVPPDDVTHDQMIGAAVAGQCLQKFGWPEPISRETLFRRLHCKVTVALNTQADRAQRVQAMQTLGATLQMMAQAAGTMSQAMAPTGSIVVFDPKPLIRAAKNMFNADEEVEDMFKIVQLPPMLPPGGPGAPQGQPGLPPAQAGEQAPHEEDKGGPLDAPTESPNTAVQPV